MTESPSTTKLSAVTNFFGGDIVVSFRIKRSTMPLWFLADGNLAGFRARVSVPPQKVGGGNKQNRNTSSSRASLESDGAEFCSLEWVKSTLFLKVSPQREKFLS